jgi:transposase
LAVPWARRPAHWIDRANVVERSFNALKQWRGVATRYDKLAPTYLSAVVLHAVLIWSPALKKSRLGDTP